MNAPAEFRPTAPWSQPVRLWSVWDMLTLTAEAFYNIGRTISEMRVGIRLTEAEGHFGRSVKDEPDTHRKLMDFAANFVTATPHLGCHVSFIIGKRLVVNLAENSSYTFKEFAADFHSLESAFQAELSTQKVLVLDARLAPFF